MACIVIGIEWWFTKWFEPPLAMSIAAIGIGLALFMLWYLFFNYVALRRLSERMSEEISEEEIARLEALSSSLDKLGYSQGADQVQKLRQMFGSLTDVLNRRLNAGELTYGRYFSVAEQVYLSAIDNLHDAEVALNSVKSADNEYINERLSELEGTDGLNDEQVGEIAALKERRQLLDRQIGKASDLIAQNETAITVLMNAATAMADAKTKRGGASIGPKEAMAELTKLAKRAGKYSTKT